MPAGKPAVAAAPDARSMVAGAEGRAAVIDIGSNSVRLVVYAGVARTPLPVFNEKVLCGLGRDLEATGRLDETGKVRALLTLRRFAGLIGSMAIEHPIAVATAAVRDAADGTAFLETVQRETGLAVRMLSGPDEARISALGVLSAAPEARGLMGDLGGGSLELVHIDEGGIGEGSTLPLGVLRLMAGGGRPARRRRRVDEALGGIDWLPRVHGQDLYVVGGAWRALGRIHMAQTRHPLRVLHGYAAEAGEVASLCDLIAGQSRGSLKNMEGVPKGRLDTLPHAALTLGALLRLADPARVMFSAYGLREGLIFDRLPETVRQQDPLVAACRLVAQLTPRFPVHGEEILNWLDPLFGDEGPRDRRLRLAASLLSDVGWRVHPDYRADHAMSEILRAPIVGLDHRARVKLALAVRARYTHKDAEAAVAPYRSLLQEGDVVWAIRVGQALRLAQTLSAGVPSVLGRFQLELRADRVVLRSLAGAPEPLEEVVEGRLKQLADAFGRVAIYLPGY